MRSICELGFTLSMCCVSTKCCHVLVRIGFRLAWGVLLVRHRVSVLVWLLDRCSRLYSAKMETTIMLRRLCAAKFKFPGR
ncbi:60S ribosomal protein l10 [Phtheirospermum japonicum]|uniref:60S ribosomal protein l10 n=1 Tax=Phtheirospermum japonicum TaxID=374723 RepID=A0A830BWY7_9LAMI|nr:60S ribosomal protein l10 [Phtheirospermum japonicum]